MQARRTYDQPPGRGANLSGTASRLDLIVHGGNIERISIAQSQSPLEYEQTPMEMDEEDLKRRKTIYTWLKPNDMENEQYT
jgi:hypothetical protein